MTAKPGPAPTPTRKLHTSPTRAIVVQMIEKAAYAERGWAGLRQLAGARPLFACALAMGVGYFMARRAIRRM